MNMKKTIAAIAAGTVAISAMAATVSADDTAAKGWGAYTGQKFNLVHVWETKGAPVAKLHIEQTNINAVAGDKIQIVVPYLNEDDVISVNGEYANNTAVVFRPMTFKHKNGSAAVKAAYNNFVAAGSGATSYIEIDVVDANINAPFTIKGSNAVLNSTVAVTSFNVADNSTAGTIVGLDLDAATKNAIAVKLEGYGSGVYKLIKQAGGDWDIYSGITAVPTGTSAVTGNTGLTIDAASTGTVAANLAAGDSININFVDKTQNTATGVNLYIDIEKTKLDDAIDNVDKATLAANGTDTITTHDLEVELKNVSTINPSRTWKTNDGSLDFKVNSVDRATTTHEQPYKTTINTGILPSDALGTTVNVNNANVLEHVYTADGKTAIQPYVVSNIINDAINHYGAVSFKFNTATKKVNTATDEYADDKDDFTAFNKNYWDLGTSEYAFNGTSYWVNDWNKMNLYSGALIINGQLTYSLADAQSMTWTGTSLIFDWDAIQSEALNPNAYTNYVTSMALRTSVPWYWDSFELILADAEAEDAGSGEGDVAEPDTIDDDDVDDTDDTDIDDGDEDDGDEDDGDEDDGDEDDGDEDDGDEDDGDEDDGSDVGNEEENTSPKTGNPAVALAVIPVALAAAAVVAKKRG